MIYPPKFVTKFWCSHILVVVFCLLSFHLQAQNQPVCTCINGDFETGSFMNWQGETGWCCGINTTPSGIVGGRHTIMAGGIDPYSCGTIQMVPPGAGSFTARLGNSNVGAEAERLRYTFKIDTTNNLFIYRYAVVLEDPGHPADAQPRFEFKITNQANQVIDPTCGYTLWVSGQNTGTQQWKYCNSAYYRDWEIVGLDMTPYMGQTITVDFATGDCAYGGHFGYAYIDAFCTPLKITTKYCTGANTAVLTAPEGFDYLWTPGNLTTKTITIQNPINGQKYNCFIKSLLNPACNATLTTILKPIDVTTDFAASSLCFNDVKFIDKSITPSQTTLVGWNWNFGDPGSGPKNTSTIQNPSHQYNSVNTFNVTLISTNSAGCSDTITKQITTVPVPKANFSANNTCLQTATQFTDLSTLAAGTITTWKWDFGDGGSSTQQNPSYVYALPGTYTVQLVAGSNTACNDTIKKQVVVYPKPDADFKSTTICFKSPSTLTDASTILTGTITGWEWNFGDGIGTSTLQNPAYAYQAASSFNVSHVAISDKGCRDTVTKPVVVDPLPVAGFTTTPVCLHATNAFTDNSQVSIGNISSWSWTFGDGASSLLINPTHTYLADGTFTATLVVISNKGCKDTLQKQITVFPLPKAQFGSYDACYGYSNSFTDSSSVKNGSVNAWSWDFGNGTFSSSQSPAYTYPAAGAYQVTLIATTNNACKDTIVKSLIIHPKPKSNFNYTLPCAGDGMQFTDMSSVVNDSISLWNWDFGDGKTDVVSNPPSHVYPLVQSYPVLLVVTTSNGCRDSLKKTVFINPKPIADFSAPKVCYGSATAFTDKSSISSGNISLWNWDFGDLNTSVASNPSHSYAKAGTYITQLIVTSGPGCKDTVFKPITVYHMVVPKFSATTVCQKLNTLFTDSSTLGAGNITAWSWNYGDGTPLGSIQNPAHLYAASGTYTVQLTATTNFGCKASVSNTVTVHPLPVSSFSASPVCLLYTSVFNDASSVSSGSVVGWDWDFMDASPHAMSKNPKHTYANYGTFPVQLITNTNFGCKDTLVQNVEVYPLPKASFVATTVCLTSPNTFNDLSTTVMGDAIKGWEWSFGDGNASALKNTNHTYNSCGSYNARLVTTSQNNCRDTAYKSVTVHCKPLADYSVPNVCLNFQSAFSDSSTVQNSNIASWKWDFDDNSAISVQKNPSHTYSADGTYQVSLSVVGANGCKDTIVKPLTIYPLPLANFNVPPVCFHAKSQFSDLSSISGGNIIKWNWTFGDNTADSVTNPIHQYNSDGSFATRLIITSNYGCLDTISKNTIVYPLPVANYSNTSECLHFNTQFNSTSFINSGSVQGWKWDFGDGKGSSSLSDPSYLYAADGTYQVRLIAVSNFGCVDTITQPVVVYPLPVAEFSNTTECMNFPTVFTNASSISSGKITNWIWSFGDSKGISVVKNPHYIYGVDSVYMTQLIATSSLGCKDTIIHPVVVHPLPIAKFTSTSECLHFQTQFTDLSTIKSGSVSSHQWSFGDQYGKAVVQNPSYDYPTDGTFLAELIVGSSFGCLDTVYNQVTVYPLPKADFNVKDVCLKFSSVFADSTKISSGIVSAWNWNFGENTSGPDNTSALQNPSHLYANCGNYPITLISTSGFGCKDTVTKNSNIFCLPHANFVFDKVCLNQPTHFVDSSTISSGNMVAWLYDFNENGAYSKSADTTHQYANYGDYWVRHLVVSNHGCIDSVHKKVTVYPLPTAGFTATNVCLNVQSSFTDMSSFIPGNDIIGWNYNFGDQSGTSSNSNPQYTYTKEGVFQVRQIVMSNKLCRDTAYKTLEIYPIPQVNFGDLQKGCVPMLVSFKDLTVITKGNLQSWLWSFGDGYTSSLQNPDHLYNPMINNPVNYSVSLTVSSDQSCVASYTNPNMITLYPLPSAGFTMNPNPASILVPHINFKDLSIGNGAIVKWEWSFGDDVYESASNPVHTYLEPGTYKVRLVIVNQYGCVDTTYRTMEVGPEFVFYIPNAFTPDNDSKNDYFFGSGIGIADYRMDIFDRWGNRIFYTTNLSIGWDGKANGGSMTAQQDVYVYVVNIVDVFGEKHKYVGHFTLVR